LTDKTNDVEDLTTEFIELDTIMDEMKEEINEYMTMKKLNI